MTKAEQSHGGPTFEAPSPTRSQVLARRVAGRVLGLKGETSPQDAFHAAVTQIGGYETTEDGEHLQYKHDGVQIRVRQGMSDETIDPTTNFVTGYATSRDHEDAKGLTFLEGATKSTLQGKRQSGEMSGTLRANVATRLLRHALKGISVDHHGK